LRVTGRKRDVFNTPEGSNIYPERIETMIEMFPDVDQVMLVGDQRPFLVAFIVIRPEVLAAAGIESATSANNSLIERTLAPNLFTGIERALDDLNSRLEPIERVRRFVLMATPFPTQIYASVGPAKIRRDRAAFVDLFVRTVAQLFEKQPRPIAALNGATQ
jgi:long-chain acyl-CoA synthetase